eukprot:TRINITY_DN5697_c0_g1_i1.p1 TRINITY_DN5697_c0_g1~~TRINITY_DN5697_c0_g1_i1.p1  ORF type:complete len:169 (+),score=26.93 TRINITY_DN5697_c0_g1_i1:147-653(+)
MADADKPSDMIDAVMQCLGSKLGGRDHESALAQINTANTLKKEYADAQRELHDILSQPSYQNFSESIRNMMVPLPVLHGHLGEMQVAADQSEPSSHTMAVLEGKVQQVEQCIASFKASYEAFQEARQSLGGINPAKHKLDMAHEKIKHLHSQVVKQTQLALGGPDAAK